MSIQLMMSINKYSYKGIEAHGLEASSDPPPNNSFNPTLASEPFIIKLRGFG